MNFDISDQTQTRKYPVSIDDRDLFVKKRYYVHDGNENFHRMMFWLLNAEKKEQLAVPIAMIQYFYVGEKRPLTRKLNVFFSIGPQCRYGGGARADGQILSIST